MKLFLCHTEDHTWEGLVDIDGETFKVNIFPGSATKDWQAMLMSGGWTELTPGNKLTLAIERAYADWKASGLPITISQQQTILEAIKDHPELMDEIVKILRGG